MPNGVRVRVPVQLDACCCLIPTPHGWLPLHPAQRGRVRTARQPERLRVLQVPRRPRLRNCDSRDRGPQDSKSASTQGSGGGAGRTVRGEAEAHMLRYSDGILILVSAHSLVTTSWQPRREVSSRHGAWHNMSSSSSLAAARLLKSSGCRMQWLHTRPADARHVSARCARGGCCTRR